MKKTILQLGLALALGTGTLLAQEAEAPLQRHQYGFELGSHNGFGYEFRLSRRFSLTARTVLGIGLSYGKGASGKAELSFSGLGPSLEFAPRWYFSKASTSPYYQKGGYLSFRLGIQGGNKLSLFGPKPSEYGWIDYGLLQSLSFGWTFGLSQKSYLRTSLGLGKTRSRIHMYDGTKYWSTSSQRGEIPVLMELQYGIRL